MESHEFSVSIGVVSQELPMNTCRLPAAIACGLLFTLVDSLAASYPQRSVRVLVGQGPGGGTDSVGRLTALKLGEVYGQPFVVDNRPSAGGNVAGELAAKATPDGHTL